MRNKETFQAGTPYSHRKANGMISQRISSLQPWTESAYLHTRVDLRIESRVNAVLGKIGTQGRGKPFPPLETLYMFPEKQPRTLRQQRPARR